MKKIRKKIFEIMGKMVMTVALSTIVMGYGHCLIILHQPSIPEKLKRLKLEESMTQL